MPEEPRSKPGGGDSRERLTIDELAQATGMTVRNIRNHQSRGLLPPPEVVARTGYYGPEHVERLRLIQEMQADGFNLNAIKRLLAGPGGAGTADSIIGFKRAVTAPFEAEDPEVVSTEELAERFGALDEKVLEKARRLELLLPLGEGRYEVPSPSLLRAAEEVTGRGVDMSTALDVCADVKRHCQSISRGFVKLFLDELWRPVRDLPEPEQRWPDVVESIERLRPVASEVVLALFKQTMAESVERAFARELERQAKRNR